MEKPELIERLLAHCQRRHFAAKSSILRQGAPANDLYYILSGAVSVTLQDEDGRELVLSYLNEGDFFGELGFFGQDHARSAQIRARTDCEVAQISYEQAHALGESLPELIFLIAGQMAERLSRTNQKVGDLAFTDVSGRIARTLLELCEQPDALTHPDGMQIRVTRQELSRFVGCSREMVGRVLKSLEEQHLISVSGKTIVVFGAR